MNGSSHRSYTDDWLDRGATLNNLSLGSDSLSLSLFLLFLDGGGGGRSERDAWAIRVAWSLECAPYHAKDDDADDAIGGE